MAEEIINIATLTIDKTEANKSIVDTKQEIFELQKANAALRKDIKDNGDATGEQTKKFVDNEIALKRLQAQYRTQSAAINDLTLAELKENKALNESVKSRDQAIAQNKELKTVRDQLNTSTDDGKEALKLLNEQIDRNNDYLLRTASTQEKASTITGNYRQKIFELGSSIDGIIPGFSQARTVVQGFGSVLGVSAETVTEYTNSAIQSTRATLGFRTSSQLAAETTVAQTAATEAQTVAQTGAATATTATAGSLKILKLAIIATGIGALVILLVAVATALSQNEEASNKFSKALSGFKGILNAVLSVLKPLGEFLIDNIVKGFEFAGAAAEKALGLISAGLAAIGLDDAAKSVDGFTKSVKGSIQAAQLLSAEEAKLAKAQRLSQKIQLDYQKQAEKLRQIRDDESKSTAQRVAANSQLGETLKRQAAEELGIANQAVGIAKLRVKLTGESKANLDALAETQTQVSDIQERIVGQESEQLANLNSLRKEANDKAKALSEAALQANIKDKEDEIAIQRAKNAQLKQTDSERLEFLNFISREEIRLIEFKASKGLITGKEAQLASLNVAKNQSEETLALAQKTIDEELTGQAKKFEDKKKLSEQDMIEEVSNATFLRDIQVKRIEGSKLLESEKALALIGIQQGYISSIKLIEKNYEDSKRQRKELARQEAQTLADVSAEMRILALQEQGAAETEVQRLTLDIQLEQKKLALGIEYANEKRTAEEIRVLKELEDKKYAVATKKINDQVAAAKRATNLGMVKDSLAAASAIFGENKAVAVAMALVNTYEGIAAGVKLGYPAAIPAVAAAAATGFAAVKNILKTDKSGGGGGGSSSSGASSVSTPAAVFSNPARTQTVATVDAAPNIDPKTVQVPVLVLSDVNELNKQNALKVKSD